jgi:hypothetical protein
MVELAAEAGEVWDDHRRARLELRDIHGETARLDTGRGDGEPVGAECRECERQLDRRRRAGRTVALRSRAPGWSASVSEDRGLPGSSARSSSVTCT